MLNTVIRIILCSGFCFLKGFEYIIILLKLPNKSFHIMMEIGIIANCHCIFECQFTQFDR